MAVGNCIQHPRCNAQADRRNVDELLGLLRQLKQDADDLRIAELDCRKAIADLCHGDQQTLHISGELFEATVSMPRSQWDQRVLKGLYHMHPEWSREYIRASRYEPNLRKVRTLANTTFASEEEQNLADELLSAEKPSGAIPYVTVKVKEKKDG